MVLVQAVPLRCAAMVGDHDIVHGLGAFAIFDQAEIRVSNSPWSVALGIFNRKLHLARHNYFLRLSRPPSSDSSWIPG